MEGGVGDGEENDDGEGRIRVKLDKEGRGGSIRMKRESEGRG